MCWFLVLKALSHWRRRRRDYRDWSVAATRETKNSLRSHQSGDVAATAPCLYIPRSTTRSIIRWCQHTLSHVITKVGSNSVKQCRGEVAATSPQSPAGLGDVAETSPQSPAGLGDVAETSRGRLPQSRVKLVSATNGDVAETSPRPAGDWKKSPKNRTCLIFPRLPGDPACLQETSRRRRGDVSATSGDSSRQLVAN